MRPGQRLGQYELICQTAQGGMATIWLARSTGSRGFTKVVAIKAMLPAVLEDPDAERMFLSEAAVASRIEHPNVVQTLDLCEDEGVLYLVMEWVRGEALSTVFSAAAERGGIPLGTAVRIVSQVAAGLHAAHELVDASGKCLGLVHRDVSPHNVLIGFNGVVKLVDFGIAKLTAYSQEDSEPGHELRGKVAYMAPEQIRLEPLDRRADVFAAGILLYLLTTGRHPFRCADQQTTALAIISDEPVPRPSTVREGYPAKLERVVLRALAKKPEDRYATARQFADDLLRALPPSFQGAGHDELRAYMKELLPVQFARHQELVRIAREIPDPAFASAPVSIGQVFKQTGRSSSTLRAVYMATDEGKAFGSVAPPPDVVTLQRPSNRARPNRTALAVLGGSLLVALGLAAVIRSPAHPGALQSGSVTPVDSQGAAPPRTTEDVPPTQAPVPVASGLPAESAVELPVAPAPDAVSREAVPHDAVMKASRAPQKARPRQAVPARKNVTELKDPY
jgi:eukaryotic-like serine/threonine-protein kinase